MDKVAYSMQEISEMTGMSLSAVYSLVRTGKLVSIPVDAPLNQKFKPLRVPKWAFDEMIYGKDGVNE